MSTPVERVGGAEVWLGDCRHVLPLYPPATFDVVVTGISDLQAGKAGEYLVCADLILQGHVAFPSEQGLPYDVVVDCAGRLLKVQVKTTRAPLPVPQRQAHQSGYLFTVKRCGKNGRGIYQSSDVDVFALVALDAREIGYLAAPDVKQSMVFRPSSMRGERLDEVNSKRNAEVRELRQQGMSYREIGERFGFSLDNAFRICNGKDRAPGRYLSDYAFKNAVKSIRQGVIRQNG
jgi:hypothetical protein